MYTLRQRVRAELRAGEGNSTSVYIGISYELTYLLFFFIIIYFLKDIIPRVKKKKYRLIEIIFVSKFYLSI